MLNPNSLSENTKRGLREKVRRGEFPGPAPLGYLNDYRTKKIHPDPALAPVVKEAFEIYARGDVTFDAIRDFFAKHGVTTKTGKQVLRGQVSQIFNNPFYYGDFSYTGEIHRGTHEPIITKKLFDDVQNIINKRWRWTPRDEEKRTPKAFAGLMRCAECGYGISAEIQKGHTYYRCSKKSKVKRCSQPYAREEALDAQISALLKPFALRIDWADAMLTRVKEEKRQSAQSAASVAAQKRAEIEKINLRLKKLLDSFLDGVIEREEFTVEKARLMSQKRSLEEQSTALLGRQPKWVEPFQKWILIAKTAGEVAQSGSLQQKRVLAEQVFGSNLVLDSKKARGSCVKPWSLLVEKSPCGGMVRGIGFEPMTPTVSR